MPFKCRDRRNKYFKEYMRKWRAEKRNQNLGTESIISFKTNTSKESRKDSNESMLYEILAA